MFIKVEVADINGRLLDSEGIVTGKSLAASMRLGAKVLNRMTRLKKNAAFHSVSIEVTKDVSDERP